MGDFVTDLDPNNQTIIDAFTFSSDKAKAAKLIANASPISCLFGDVNQRKHIVFIIDYSGSMSTTMRTPTGATVTRLQFVQSQSAASQFLCNLAAAGRGVCRVNK